MAEEKTVKLSDETIEKLAEALRVRIAPLQVGYPVYIDLTYRPPYMPWRYPYVTSQPNSGSVSGAPGGTLWNGA